MSTTEKVRLERFPSAEHLARQVAERLWDELRRAQSDSFSLALSGGRISRVLFEVLRETRTEELLGRIDFFWADERCVPPDDPESNYRTAAELLFRPCAVAPERIHRIEGELKPEEAAEKAGNELVRLVGSGERGFPILDLVLLGMGEDGHVASLFPGEPEEVARSAAVYRPVIAPKPPPSRVTMGYGTIEAARQVWVLVSGAGKEQALCESLGLGGTPLGRVLKARDRTDVLVDSASLE